MLEKLELKAYGKANRTSHAGDEAAAGEAESIGLQGFAFIARDEERTRRFLRLTGIEPETIRDVAREPGFLSAVLGYLMSDEALLLVFCEEARIDPSRLSVLQRRLEAAAGA